MASELIFKIEYYVPETHLGVTKQALFAAGAGKVGNYDNCAWQTSGSGQFRPGPDSAPFLGQSEQLETVKEAKVELVCHESCIKAAIQALKTSHPYEEPAYAVIRLESF